MSTAPGPGCLARDGGHGGGQPLRHLARSLRGGGAQLGDDLGDAGAALEQVVGALAEGQAGAGQRLAEHGRLGVGAVEHRDVGQAQPGVPVTAGPAAVQGVERGAAEQLVDRGADPGRLGVLVGGLVRGDRRARGHRLEPAAGHQGGRGHGGGRGGHDGPAGPVADAELAGGGGRVVLAEPQEEADVSAAKAVDRLIRVADGGQARPVPGQQPQQLVLGGVDVLVLIDADHRPAPAQAPGGVRVRAEQGHGELDEAVEVDQAPRGQLLDQGLPRGLVAGGRGQQVSSGLVRPGQLGRDGQHGRLVGHLEVCWQPGQVVQLAQDQQAQPVKGGHGDVGQAGGGSGGGGWGGRGGCGVGGGGRRGRRPAGPAPRGGCASPRRPAG